MSKMNYNELTLRSDRLRALLSSRHMTQLKLSNDLNINKDYLSQLLRKRIINMDLLIRISQVLDCHPYHLIELPDNKDFDVPALPFATYKGWSYDYDYCVRGLLHMKSYSPSDFSDQELTELRESIGALIDGFAVKRWKQQYSSAEWAGAGDSGTVTITFDKSKPSKTKKTTTGKR